MWYDIIANETTIHQIPNDENVSNHIRANVRALTMRNSCRVWQNVKSQASDLWQAHRECDSVKHVLKLILLASLLPTLFKTIYRNDIL